MFASRRSGRPAILAAPSISRWIPLGELAARVAEIPLHEPVVLVCRIGGRSHLATGYLRGLGYDQAVNFDGGMLAWEKAGHPIE